VATSCAYLTDGYMQSLVSKKDFSVDEDEEFEGAGSVNYLA
jgi:hypothetical protein